MRTKKHYIAIIDKKVIERDLAYSVQDFLEKYPKYKHHPVEVFEKVIRDE